MSSLKRGLVSGSFRATWSEILVLKREKMARCLNLKQAELLPVLYVLVHMRSTFVLMCNFVAFLI